MKKLLLIPILLLFGLLITSCDEETTSPESGGTNKGSIFIQSTPSGAQIFVNGSNSSKVTPDTIKNLDSGFVNITLKLAGYKDTTFSREIVPNMVRSVSITMSADLVTQKFTTTIWETAGTGAAQPSGIDLSTGSAYGISSTDKNKVDLFYSSSGYLIRSADAGSGMTRVTYFKDGNATNLNDGVSSPTQDASWAKSMGDRATNYFFIKDNDGNYSKVRIKSYGTTPVAWVELEWIYNKTSGDKRFP